MLKSPENVLKLFLSLGGFETLEVFSIFEKKPKILLFLVLEIFSELLKVFFIVCKWLRVACFARKQIISHSSNSRWIPRKVWESLQGFSWKLGKAFNNYLPHCTTFLFALFSCSVSSAFYGDFWLTITLFLGTLEEDF